MKQIHRDGLGYIGLPTAITMAQAGYPVVGFDVSAPVIETLQGGKIHIVEPGLQEAFTAALESGNLTFSTDLPESDVYYISVPTPFYRDEEGRSAPTCPMSRAPGAWPAGRCGPTRWSSWNPPCPPAPPRCWPGC